MPVGRPSIMTLTGATSTAVGGSSQIWGADVSQTPFSVTIASVMNSTATTPAYSLYVTNDTPTSGVTASSSSGANLFNTSTTFNSSVTWFSSFASALSSNSLVNITTPFRFLTLVATANSSNATITATIVQAG